MTVQVTVKLHGVLRRRRPAGLDGAAHHPFPFSIAPASTIHDLAQALGIDDGLVNAAAVNGEAVPPETILADGDVVNLFPPAAGG